MRIGAPAEITNLILRTLSPGSGSIELDGTRADQVPADWLRAHLALEQAQNETAIRHALRAAELATIAHALVGKLEGRDATERYVTLRKELDVTMAKARALLGPNFARDKVIP